jgi:hypothetical protein
VLRSYPFSLRSSAGGGEPTLCVDEDSGLVVPADDKTEKFFEADGSLGDEGTEAWRARILHRRWCPADRTRRSSHRTCGAAIRAFDVESIAGGAR